MMNHEPVMLATTMESTESSPGPRAMRSRRRTFTETLESFWETICPILENLFDKPEAPLDTDAYSSVYSKSYAYVTNPKGGEVRELPVPLAGYRKIDDFFAEQAKKVFDEAPAEHDVRLVRYILAEFTVFSKAVHIVSHMLAMFDRYLVSRLVQAGYGWYASRKAEPVQYKYFRHQNQQRLKLEKEQKIARWGYHKDADPKNLDIYSEVESWAEAGSNMECIVPISSLAYRRFRVAILEPLLSMGAEGDLTATIEGLLDQSPNQKLAVSEREGLILGLRAMFRRCGIDPEQPVRVKLESYIGLGGNTS